MAIIAENMQNRLVKSKRIILEHYIEVIERLGSSSGSSSDFPLMFKVEVNGKAVTHSSKSGAEEFEPCYYYEQMILSEIASPNTNTGMAGVSNIIGLPLLIALPQTPFAGWANANIFKADTKVKVTCHTYVTYNGKNQVQSELVCDGCQLLSSTDITFGKCGFVLFSVDKRSFTHFKYSDQGQKQGASGKVTIDYTKSTVS
jgi:hypothetical protein